MVLILSDEEVSGLVDMTELLPAVKEAFLKQGRGEVERPDRPVIPVGQDPKTGEALGLSLTMPAYIHGAGYYITKLVAYYEGNRARGLPTNAAQIIANNATTGVPEAYLAGTRIGDARTGCIGGLAVSHLGPEPVTLGVIGAGAQARWQSRGIAAASTVEEIRVYSPSDSKYACAEELAAELGIPARAEETPEDTVTGANVVVTATTAAEPVFPTEALDPGTLVISVGSWNPDMQELEAELLHAAKWVIADVPSEAVDTGDVQAAGLTEEDLVPFSDALANPDNYRASGEFVVLTSVGSAVLDAAAVESIVDRAKAEGIGTEVSL